MDCDDMAMSQRGVLEQSGNSSMALVFEFSEMGVGDCVQTNGKIHFYPNGTGLFECDTLARSTHSGDV